jgi:flagellar motor switch protein FliM
MGLHAIADAGVWRLVPPAERMAAHQPALVSLDRAAQSARLRLEVMLGDAELELPKVMDLRVGDVLRLSARLHEPLTVSCEGRPFARALLGVADGRKAIQFTVEENPS